MLYSRLMVVYESQSSALLKLTQYDTIFEILPGITVYDSNYFLPHCTPRAYFLDTLPKNSSHLWEVLALCTQPRLEYHPYKYASFVLNLSNYEKHN